MSSQYQYEHDQRLPRFEMLVQYHFGKQTHRHLYVGDIPGEIMDFYQEVVGNGLARVGVTADMADKEYGKGVSCSVYLSLTCNQDQNTINRAAQMASSFALYYVKSQVEAARKEFLQLTAPQADTPNFG